MKSGTSQGFKFIYGKFYVIAVPRTFGNYCSGKSGGVNNNAILSRVKTKNTIDERRFLKDLHLGYLTGSNKKHFKFPGCRLGLRGAQRYAVQVSDTTGAERGYTADQQKKTRQIFLPGNTFN
ncbi:MAG TPA: hypothetical protein VF610_05385 [Segetibacter sp.]